MSVQVLDHTSLVGRRIGGVGLISGSLEGLTRLEAQGLGVLSLYYHTAFATIQCGKPSKLVLPGSLDLVIISNSPHIKILYPSIIILGVDS